MHLLYVLNKAITDKRVAFHSNI